MVVGLGAAWWVEHRQHDGLRDQYQAMERSHDMLTNALEQTMDALTQRAIIRGDPVMLPIYASEEESLDVKTKQVGSE